MKVGLIVGREQTFPPAFIESVNSRNAGVTAEFVKIGGTSLLDTVDYAVIVDRMSHEVPYYRAYLKKAVADGCIVVNNPFWWTADDKFFNCVLAQRLGVEVPKTVVLPNKTYEADVTEASFRNLAPIDWASIAAYTGLPAVLKPGIGGGAKNVSMCDTLEELEAAYDRSGHLLMVVQEKIEYESYARCFCIAREHVRVARYEHRNPYAERYREEGDQGFSPELEERIKRDCLTLCRALGYDMNTVELAVRDGIPYAIDFLNPAPEFERHSMKPHNFDWVVQHMTELVISYAHRERTLPTQEISWQRMLNAVPAI